MSVIVVLKEKDKYIVGCDTRISSDNGSFIDDYYQVKKARHIDFNNEVIIGAVGRVSILDNVEHIISEMKTLNKRTIITELIPKLQKSILNPHCCNQHFEMEAEIILAIKNKGKYMNIKKVHTAINNISVAIDILQATTDYYKHLESVEANDLIKLNDIAHISLRDSVNDIIAAIHEEKKED